MMAKQIEKLMVEAVEAEIKRGNGGPPAGKGATRKYGSASVRVGRLNLPDGRYYVSAMYKPMESYDDDFEAGKGVQEASRISDTLTGLLSAATRPHGMTAEVDAAIYAVPGLADAQKAAQKAAQAK